MSSSNTFAKLVLDWFGAAGSATTLPLFISLHTGDPGTTGAMEVSNATYSRVTLGGWNTMSAGTSVTTQPSVLTFATGGNDETVTYAGVHQAVSGTSFCFGGSLTTSFVYGAAVTPVFDVGGIRFGAT